MLVTLGNPWSLAGSGRVSSTGSGRTKQFDYDLDSLLKTLYREMLVRDGSTRAGLQPIASREFRPAGQNDGARIVMIKPMVRKARLL
jgi:hypothetical protein